jgi:uncharacterized cupredoxin-like copper-binding protein
MNRLVPPLVVVSALLAGCHSLPGPSPDEVARVVTATDWSRTTDIDVVLRDSGITPGVIHLRAGEPYRLRIVNAGVNNHYFNAADFFASIAARKAEVPRFAEVKAPQFTTFEVFAAGGQVDLWFVPLQKGRYRAHCHLGNHAEMGVEAFLIVE